jgi:hypothetical protein
MTKSYMDADYLILADRAEAVNGKLYMVGGGWDRVGMFQIPGPANFDLAVGVLVGYNETNTPHHIELALEDDDNKNVQPPIKAQFEVGKPPGMKVGQAQRFQLVLRGPFHIPKPGAYHWVLSLDGARKSITRFWVDKVALPAGAGPIPSSPA